MKKTVLFFLAIISIAALTCCNNTPKGDAAKVEEAKPTQAPANDATMLKVDASKSSITWIGSKPLVPGAAGKHNGTFGIKEGGFNIKDNMLQAGSIIISVAELTVTDPNLDEGSKGKLAEHLKSPDFFDTAKFPTAKFELTGATPYTAPADSTQKSLLPGATHTLTGNLTLKEVTKSISFPAVIKISDSGLDAQASFNFDRAAFGLSYGNDKGLKDKFISPTVNVGFNLVATK